jgi:hypothetical protein
MMIRFLQNAMMRCMMYGGGIHVGSEFFVYVHAYKTIQKNVKSCARSSSPRMPVDMQACNRRVATPDPQTTKIRFVELPSKAGEHSTAARRLQEKLRGALSVEIFWVVVEKGARSAVGGKARRANNTSGLPSAFRQD